MVFLSMRNTPPGALQEALRLHELFKGLSGREWQEICIENF